MNLTTLRSGQLVHVYGAPTQGFGIYLEEPRSSGSARRPKRVYFYYHRAAPAGSSGTWRMEPFNSAALWLLAPLRPVVKPQLRDGVHVWRLPSQEGLPDVEIHWVPEDDATSEGRWLCTAPTLRDAPPPDSRTEKSPR